MKTKPKETDQGRILTCCVCRRTWTSMEPYEIETYLKNPSGGRCASCVYLEMVSRDAHKFGISLRQAVKDYLRGIARTTGKTTDEIWRRKQGSTPFTPVQRTS